MTWQGFYEELLANPYALMIISAAVVLILAALCVAVIRRLSRRKSARVYHHAAGKQVYVGKSADNKKMPRSADNNPVEEAAMRPIPKPLPVKNTAEAEALPQSLLPQKLLIAKHGWTEELAYLCKHEGINSVFLVLPIINELYPDIRAGYLRVAEDEKWLKQYISRLGNPGFGVDTAVILWDLLFDEALFPMLVELLANRDDNTRAAAGELLMRIKDKRSIPYLVAALMQPQRYVAARVVEVLSVFGDTAAIVLSRLLPNLSGQAQLVVLDSLSLFKPTYPMTPLFDCLNAPREQVRMFAARALGENMCTESEHILIECLNDSSWQVRAAVVKSLGQLGLPTSLPAVRRLENDEAWCVRANCKEAIKNLSAEKSSEPEMA